MKNYMNNIVLYFNFFIIYYVVIINCIYTVQLILSIFSLSRYIKKIKHSDYKKFSSSENMIPISILVPAYNEEKTIVDNIKSLLSLNYPLFEIIIINDGSNDTTLDKIIKYYDLKKVSQPIRCIIHTNQIKGIYRNIELPNLVLIDKENGGKADSLNAGINVSRYPIFTSIDADSVLEIDSLIRIIMPFIESKDTIGVGGIVRIANGIKIRNGLVEDINLPKNNMAMFQVVEYLRAFLSGRMGWDFLGSLLIISGAFGAFKKDSVLKVGGYTIDTIGEDMELVVKLHEYMLRNKISYNIKFIPDPVCWTQAPETIKDLKIQRRRWQIGLMESLFSYKHMLLNLKYKTVGIFAMPYFYFFEMLGPIIEITGYICIPISYILGILNIKYFLLFWVVSTLYGIILSICAILLEEYGFNRYPTIKQILKLTSYGIIENFGYRQMTTVFRVMGIIGYRKYKSDWGSIKRKNL